MSTAPNTCFWRIGSQSLTISMSPAATTCAPMMPGVLRAVTRYPWRVPVSTPVTMRAWILAANAEFDSRSVPYWAATRLVTFIPAGVPEVVWVMLPAPTLVVDPDVLHCAGTLTAHQPYWAL